MQTTYMVKEAVNGIDNVIAYARVLNDISEFMPYLNKPERKVLAEVFTSHTRRNEGHATKVMTELLADADKEGITLYVEVVPGRKTDFYRLENWYKKLGFKPIVKYPQWMKREPQGGI